MPKDKDMRDNDASKDEFATRSVKEFTTKNIEKPPKIEPFEKEKMTSEEKEQIDKKNTILNTLKARVKVARTNIDYSQIKMATTSTP